MAQRVSRERKQDSAIAAESGLKSRQNERQEAVEATGRREDSKRVTKLRKKSCVKH